MESEPPYVVFLGNPGAGKSTILNTLTETETFPSGPSIGGGLTKTCQLFPTPSCTLCDTPGLDDPASRTSAAATLSTLFSSATAVKLIFVITLEGTTVRAGDIATVHTIITALHDADTRVGSKFTICVNKCSVDNYALLQTPARRAHVAASFQCLGHEPSVYALPCVPHVSDALNARLSGYERRLHELIAATPLVYLTPGRAVKLDRKAFPLLLRQLQSKVEEREDTLAQQQMENQRLRSSKWRRQFPRIVFYVFRMLGMVSVAFAVVAVPGALFRVLKFALE